MELKKYVNRRLYDTGGSRYVTLEEIAERVRLGEDLRVVDAKTGRDLTQVTLAQLILESRGAVRLLPVPLLKQLLRMQDDALAEFFGRYVTWALEVYLRLKQGARMWNPLASLGFGAPELLAPEPADTELAQLRRELDELKRVVRDGREPRPTPPPAVRPAVRPRARRST